MNAGAVVGIIIAVLAIIALWRALVIVRQYERGLVKPWSRVSGSFFRSLTVWR
jgi:regulator of protease activity HflC (stomatin/prohibitin superfamily)